MEISMTGLAILRGEILAANLLAAAAIRAALAITPDKKEFLEGMSAYIDGTLNISGPAKGDTNDELNTQMRETARFQAMQQLDAIAHMLGNSPTTKQ